MILCTLTLVFFLLIKDFCAERVDDTLADKYLLHQFIEIKNGSLLYDEETAVSKFGDSYQGVLKLAQEAHEKYHFKDGLVYINPRDGRHNDTLFDPRIYYTAYNISQSRLYRPRCGPDFTAMSWSAAQLPSFADEIPKIVAASQIQPTSQKVGWIGNSHTNPMRVHLVEIGKEHPDIFDFRHLDANNLNSASGGYTSIPKLVEEHAYLIDIPGSGYSGRLKFLLHSNRPLFYVERVHVEYFNEDLIPNVHYIPIKHDLSNLVSQHEWAVNNPEKVAEIANNALMFAQANLTHSKFVDRLAEVFKFVLESEKKIV